MKDIAFQTGGHEIKVESVTTGGLTIEITVLTVILGTNMRSYNNVI